MSMKILKASAGSGKTFNLAKEYIRLLLSSDSPEAYRHILAVTFTNKATDEMKRRILRELYTLATDPDHSPYIDALVPSVLATRAEAKRKAEAMMTGILHDWGSFAVSTIDKFFQQTLRAFSREIGQFTSYQVELDKDSLVDEAVDRVMENLSTQNRPLLDWVIRGVRSDLETTGRFTLDRRLRELATSIVAEDTRDILLSQENLEGLREGCREIVSRFTGSVMTAATAVVSALEGSGISASDTNRGFLKSVYDYLSVGERELIVPPTASFLDKAADPEKWFAKAKAALLPTAVGVLSEPLAAFTDLFGAPYKEYATAKTIDGQIYGLGLAGELRKAFVEVQKERGVISIEDTNTILHDIIDGTDTPFLYEKLGVRFEDFLLDEFQDTSGIQWDNILPLLQNSDAEGKDNLVVGDVKQSIYRWRGSQWDLLDSRLQRQFHVPAEDITVLDGNYRTCREVVKFNNEFFPYAAAEIDRLVGNNPAAMDSVRSIYGDVIQQPRTKDGAPGMVDIRFVASADDELSEVVSTIHQVVAQGAHHSDIAILVRGNAEGAAIAERLIAEGIPVISDDSLYVKSSVTVRRLVSQLAVVDNPTRARGGSVEGFLSKELSLDVPTRYHCLTDLAESVLAGLKEATPELFASETAFIQAFMDWLQEWTRKNGNNLAAMLRDWADAEPKIASPEGNSAVRIMTVHKSKGLEFPYVIFPFAEKVTLYKPTSYWCAPSTEGTALGRIAGKRFRTSLSDTSMNTLFKDDYIRERSQQAVDNINVFYVAMTRARCGLKVIAAKPPKSVVDAVAAGNDVPAKSIAHLLYAFVNGQDYTGGEPYDFSTLERSADGPAPLTVQYVCSGAETKRRLTFRTRRTEQFIQEDGAPVAEQAPAPSHTETADVVIEEPTLF